MTLLLIFKIQGITITFIVGTTIWTLLYYIIVRTVTNDYLEFNNTNS